MNIFWKEMCMEKVRKKLIREKAVIAVYQYLLTNSTEEEIMNYLNECYKPRMDEREIELCKEIVFNTIERIDEYVPLIEKNLKKSWSIDRLSMMEKAILYVKSGGNVFASTQASARKLAYAVGNGHPIGPEIHGNGSIGYFWHYHAHNHIGGHIFFIV